jgi:hypothetical protein
VRRVRLTEGDTMLDSRHGAAICCKFAMGVGLLFLGLAAAPGTAMAASPVVTTGAASAITATSATLNGTVDPQGGQATSYRFEYDLASSQWCQSSGTTGSAAKSSSTMDLGFNDSTAHAVSATVATGNNPGTSFCFRLSASNSGGSAVGSFATFTTTAVVVSTGPATSIVNGGATLNGTINSQGSQQQYRFDYGPSSSPWCMSGGASGAPSRSGIQPFAFTDSSDHPVSAEVYDLTPSTTYCFRLVSITAGTGSSENGSLATFATAPPVTLSVHVTGPGAVNTGDGAIGCAEGGVGRCTASFVQGSVVTLNAYGGEDDDGHSQQFVGWSGACSGTEPTCTVTMSGDMTVGATFTGSSHTPSPTAVDKALAAVLTPSGPAANIASILKAGGYPAAFKAPGAGTAQIAWYQGSPSARIARAHKPLLVAKGAKTFTKAGKGTIKIKLTAAGKALLGKVKGGQKLALTAKGSFTPEGGKKTSKQKSFALKR